MRGKIAQALIPSLSQKDPYWENAARTFVTGLILYVFQGPKEERNLVRLRDLIMQGDEGAFRHLSKKAEHHGDAFDALLVMMESLPRRAVPACDQGRGDVAFANVRQPARLRDDDGDGAYIVPRHP